MSKDKEHHHRGKKAGPWSKEDKQFLVDNCDTMPVSELAARLKRNPQAIKDFIYNKLGKKVVLDSTDHLVDEYNIRNSPLWVELKKQLTKEELEVFVGHWSKIVSQFQDDVLPTEEMQIVDMVKLDIMMGRILESQLECRTKIKKLKKDIDDEIDTGNPDMIKIGNMERQIAGLSAANETTTKEFSDLLNRKALMMKELKATRAERIKNIETSKQSLMGWISEVMKNPTLRKNLGLNMEKFRLAIDLEEIRLTKPHVYMDGQEDIPVLNAEVLEKIDKEGQENDSGSNGS